MKHCAGRPEGPHVRLWQIGNELSGPEYQAILPEFCTAMKKAQRNAVLLTAYPPPDETLKKIAPFIEYVAPHYYRPEVEKDAAETDELRKRLRGMQETKHIKLAITEWNQTACWWGGGRAVQSTLGNGLYVGRMLNLYRRNGDFIRIATRSNLVDSWLSGSIQAQGSRIWFHPAYLVQRLFANRGGRHLLKVEGDCDGLDVTAALDEAGNACLTVVNLGAKSVKLEADVSAVGAFRSAKAHTVTGDDPWTTNHIAEPERIRVEQHKVTVKANAFTWAVPPYSASVLVAQ
jgi:alpha-L-arabinofuranosidase